MNLDIVEMVAMILAVLSFFIFLLAIFTSVFAPLIGLIDFILDPLAALYYKVFKRDDNAGRDDNMGRNVRNIRADYSIKQGKEVK